MGIALLYLLFAANAALSLVRPWIGVVLAYVISVMGPQYIWWWWFPDIRPALLVTLPMLCGFAISMLRGKVDYSGLNTKGNWCVAILWLSSVVAFYFGPYVDVHNDYRFYEPEVMFASWQKTCLLYLIGVLLIDNHRKLKAMSAVILITVAYMVYWANAQYFLYGKFGRLHGPMDLVGGGIYGDENNFAVLFVVGIPFLLYFGLYVKRRMLSWMAWALIPFAWHAVFLTASRGALVGIAAVLLVFVMRLRNRAAGALVVAAFLGAFAWQAGDLMKSRSATISEYENEDSAASRIRAWEAAIGMMATHPITGVGFASFGQAFPDFSDIPPRIAHNTFFQIGGEWGVIAGGAYLILIFSTLNRLRKNGNRLRTLTSTDVGKLYYYINEACLLGLTGFFVCALFLSLQQYEVLYLLLLIANGTLVFSRKSLDETKGADRESQSENAGNTTSRSLASKKTEMREATWTP